MEFTRKLCFAYTPTRWNFASLSSFAGHSWSFTESKLNEHQYASRCANAVESEDGRIITKSIEIHSKATCNTINGPKEVQTLQETVANPVHWHPLIDGEAELQNPDRKPNVESEASRHHAEAE